MDTSADSDCIHQLIITASLIAAAGRWLALRLIPINADLSTLTIPSCDMISDYFSRSHDDSTFSHYNLPMVPTLAVPWPSWVKGQMKLMSQVNLWPLTDWTCNSKMADGPCTSRVFSIIFVSTFSVCCLLLIFFMPYFVFCLYNNLK